MFMNVFNVITLERTVLSDKQHSKPDGPNIQFIYWVGCEAVVRGAFVQGGIMSGFPLVSWVMLSYIHSTQ